MGTEVDPVGFFGREGDQRLLEEDRGQLPASIEPPPEAFPESPARRQLVRFGAAMTGVTLIAGVALAILGVIELLAGGSTAWLAVLVLGVALASTHWGWVHVAELTGNKIEARRGRSLQERRTLWLGGLAPYPRWEVSTSTADDGSISIVTVCHRPVPAGERTFTFVREEVAREVHAPEEPAAAVAERAELVRARAAAETECAREDYEAARDAYQEALMIRDDEQQRQAALRAASEALSERINAHLRDPPLIE